MNVTPFVGLAGGSCIRGPAPRRPVAWPGSRPGAGVGRTVRRRAVAPAL